MDLSPLIPYAGFLVSTGALLRSHFVSRDAAQTDARLDVLEKQMGLFWKLVEQHMTTVLHSPHTPDLDKLLEKYQSGEALTEEEADDLAHRLVTLINDSSEVQGNRAGAVFLLAALNVRYKLEEFPSC